MHISHIFLLHIGIHRTDSRYLSHTFNFYLYPKAYGPIDTAFKCQSSSLEFLCQHSFDFNKFVYGGVPFLNRDQKQLLSSYLDSRTSLAGLDRQLDEDCLQVQSINRLHFLLTNLPTVFYSFIDIDPSVLDSRQSSLPSRFKQAICSRVAEWLVKIDSTPGGAQKDAATNDDNRHEILTLPAEKTLNEFTIHAELRQRFPDNLWTSFNASGAVDVVKVDRETREKLEIQEQDELKEKTLQFLTGFSRVHTYNRVCPFVRP